MKIKDIEGALSLIAAFKNADWVEEHLKALLEAKIVADKAIAQAHALHDQLDSRREALSAHEAEYQRRTTLIDQRERNLNEAQEQSRLSMANGQVALANAKSAYNALVEETKAGFVQQADILDKRSKELDRREKMLAKAELAVEERDKELGIRERDLTQAQAEHARKMAKLRELTA